MKPAVIVNTTYNHALLTSLVYLVPSMADMYIATES